MKNPLAILIRLADWRIDARQRDLAAARQEFDGLTEERDGVIAEVASEAATAAADNETLAAWTAYAARCKHHLSTLAAEIDAASVRVADAQSCLRAEYAAGKRLEILSDRRARERHAEMERQERALLDDVGQRSHQRGQG